MITAGPLTGGFLAAPSFLITTMLMPRNRTTRLEREPTRFVADLVED
ncbi:hypothetical protein [Actinomadura sp. WMMB 499]|nr:hypothetical protein [Actinomadura sp. WMMB 499]